MKIQEKLIVAFIMCWAFLSVSPDVTAQKALLSRAVKDSAIAGGMKQIATEQSLHYSKNILTQDFDFQLMPVSEGKFSINFAPNIKDIVSIKVYDIIGNVLFEEKVKVRGSYSRQVDLSTLKTNFFIVEIRNEEHNKTKSIVAS